MSKIYDFWDEIEKKANEEDDKSSKIINVLRTKEIDMFLQYALDDYYSIIWHENTSKKFNFKFNIEGFEIHTRRIDKLDKDKDVVVIENVNKENVNIFKAFTASLYDNIQNNNSSNIEDVIYSTVEDYRAFFSGKNKDMSLSQQQGLFGELLFIYENMQEKVNVVDAWEGPNKNKNDFVFDECSYEIKTTKNQMRLDVLINNECQLDTSNVNQLKMVVYKLEKVDTGNTIYDLYKEIESKLDIKDKKNFALKLYQSGMSLVDNTSYVKFKVNERLIFAVNDGFPKIDRRGLGERIFEVKYHINLDGIVAEKKEYTNGWRISE